MNKTIIFVYSYKFIQPEGAPNKTEETKKLFEILCFSIRDIIKHLGVEEKALNKFVIPLFHKKEGVIFESVMEREKIKFVTEFFDFVVHQDLIKKEKSHFAAKDFVKIEKILLL